MQHHDSLIPVFLPEDFSWVQMQLSQKMTEDEFYAFCRTNELAKIERTKDGMITMIPVVGLQDGMCKGEIANALNRWAHEYGGYALGYAVGFSLPDGSLYAPDAAWVQEEKVDKLTKKERNSFPPIVPDFIIEVRSKSDSLSKLKKKMEEVWMANGVRLAWLIDPKKKKAYIYRKNKPVEMVEDFKGTLSGEEVCPGFAFDLGLMMV